LGNEDLASRLEVLFAGSVTDEERRLLNAPDLAETVRFVGWLERSRALALQRAADALLIVTGPVSQRSVATGKLFEYLGARRPILVLGSDTEAARIVAESGAGLSVSVSDASAIAAALRRLLAATPEPPKEEDVADYAYPVLIDRMCEVIDRVVEPTLR
jgi:glycosyltransferase involved in cell wall biosynthesis